MRLPVRAMAAVVAMSFTCSIGLADDSALLIDDTVETELTPEAVINGEQQYTQVGYLDDPICGCDTSCDTPCCDGLGCDAGSCDSGCDGCGAGKKPAPGSPFKPCFFDNNFSAYVDKPPYVFGEELKGIEVGDCDCTWLTLSTGGQLRYRYMNENNRLRGNGQVHNTYDLWRWRHYINAETEFGRGYVELIEADSFNNEIAPLGIDINRWDMLNGFIDVYVYKDLMDGKGTFRWGRQELLYGDQHLISPLDWSNTRRNFEGFKHFHQAKNWRLDLFSVKPVNLAALSSGGSMNQFDTSDGDFRLNGAWLNYTLCKSIKGDAYYLYTADGQSIAGQADGDRHFIGGRIYGTKPVKECGKVVTTYDYSLGGGYQFGADDFQNVSAYYISAYGGVTLNDMCWTPRFGGLFWYGSGDENPADGTTNTVDTLYPLGHKYWGIIDNFNGQNLIDYSVVASVKPHKKLTIGAAYHWFYRASGNDAIYNIAGAPLGTPGVTLLGNSIGQELDIVGTYNYNSNLSIQLGCANFNYANGVLLPQALSGDGQFFYTQVQMNY
ncbi:alginate export family protein [Calycomorphotria hydatis]|nr:alginate export family protein [Calycomorphotria hydatis]